MAKIIVNNPKQVINGGAKKYYFKVKGLGGLKGDKGDKGDTGAQGIQGIQGLSATVRIGTTTTGEPGTQASVRNSGTESNAVLDFTIPRGDVGPQPELVQTTGTSTTKAMSQNATTEALNNISGTKQDKLTAGDNIKIENGVISSTDTTYTAGNGLKLNGTEFSADTTVLATKGNLGDYYTKPETDSLLAPKLETQMVAELPTRGEEGKLYLTPKAHTTQTATGNPITATVEEDAGALESFQLDGSTFQQSYTGKNLFNKANVVNGIPANTNGSIVSTTSVGRTTDYIHVSPNTVYSHTGHPLGWANVAWYKADKSFIRRNADATTVTSPSEAAYARVSCAQGDLETCQFEAGQPTAYEPYVGGQASPNPSYPQPIQTVTGLQTISINGTDYPLDLGSIELCKLGDYQDYIWKDGEDWKVHKATNTELLDGSETWGQDSSGGYQRFNIIMQNAVAPSGRTAIGLSSHFTSKTTDGIGIFFLASTASETIKRFYFYPESSITTVESFESWLNSNKTTLVYPLATPTDTVITDQTLIEQLETISKASLQNGANTITNTATGSNLAGDIEIGYYGYNPRNRYDKWLWLDIDNEYEQIGS